jgi:hypothetical protein
MATGETGFSDVMYDLISVQSDLPGWTEQSAGSVTTGRLGRWAAQRPSARLRA